MQIFRRKVHLIKELEENLFGITDREFKESEKIGKDWRDLNLRDILKISEDRYYFCYENRSNNWSWQEKMEFVIENMKLDLELLRDAL